MSLHSPLLSALAHVGEHIVAIACVSTFEPLCQPLIKRVAENVHQWPIAAYLTFAAAIYFTGLFTARLGFHALLRRRGRPTNNRKSAGALTPPPPPAIAFDGETMTTIIVVGPSSSVPATTAAIAAMVSAAKHLRPPA
jgi:hypothetical protein